MLIREQVCLAFSIFQEFHCLNVWLETISIIALTKYKLIPFHGNDNNKIILIIMDIVAVVMIKMILIVDY